MALDSEQAQDGQPASDLLCARWALIRTANATRV